MTKSKYVFYKDKQVIFFKSLHEMKNFVTGLLVELNKQYLIDDYIELYNQVLSFTENEETTFVTKIFTTKSTNNKTIELFALSKFYCIDDEFEYQKNFNNSLAALKKTLVLGDFIERVI